MHEFPNVDLLSQRAGLFSHLLLYLGKCFLKAQSLPLWRSLRTVARSRAAHEAPSTGAAHSRLRKTSCPNGFSSSPWLEVTGPLRWCPKNGFVPFFRWQPLPFIYVPPTMQKPLQNYDSLPSSHLEWQTLKTTYHCRAYIKREINKINWLSYSLRTSSHSESNLPESFPNSKSSMSMFFHGYLSHKTNKTSLRSYLPILRPRENC